MAGGKPDPASGPGASAPALWALAGTVLGLPAALAALLAARGRGDALPKVTLWTELADGTLGLAVAALVLGLATGIAWRRRGAGWRHATPVAAGVLAGALLLGLNGFGPIVIEGDGEGNFDAEPGGYVVLALLGALFWAGRLWPVDGSTTPLAALAALTVALLHWVGDPLTKDTSSPASWWVLAGAVAATLPALAWQNRSPGFAHVAHGVAMVATVGVGVAVVLVAALPFLLTRSSDSILPFALVLATVVLGPVALVAGDLRRLARVASDAEA